ncbi:hypothetical protein DYB37_006651 [Aphanomyces astaci]|uniref:Uncharacterized protein n=1 Tax=Aphanomyces astaci TaxID=112090 RepID=A0A397C2A2_APHAT|nr:hypothetical protein DYB25_007836 [Aphanomyces astaci]RHY56858.1 hypothetical protein DYB30_013674 [Aphanomyces astaci]RHY79976.1 hypothetical protein DYB26_005650 [Aphanomyces astaci]RHY95541.1 hypothetical protein DYB35_009381 [Aphanomyces astaci]RHZ06133.1 hypothetical protein DYB31_002927 [Aphanomyces astaci]
MSDVEESKHEEMHSDREEEEGREFIVPVHVQDLELIKRDRLFVVNVTDLSDGSKDDHIRQLKDIQRQIQNDPLGVVETDVFDMLYSFVKYHISIAHSTTHM